MILSLLQSHSKKKKKKEKKEKKSKKLSRKAEGYEEAGGITTPSLEQVPPDTPLNMKVLAYMWQPDRFS